MWIQMLLYYRKTKINLLVVQNVHKKLPDFFNLKAYWTLVFILLDFFISGTFIVMENVHLVPLYNRHELLGTSLHYGQ